jgi:hypothetical protein
LSLTLTYRGRAPYHAPYQSGVHPLIVAVECRVAGLPAIHGLLDTAAQWCVLPPALASALGCDLEPDPAVGPYFTRYGALEGRLERYPLSFVPEEGEEVEVEATWFVLEQWPGPLVIGWTGCLERVPFALDPSPREEWFYFGKS